MKYSGIAPKFTAINFSSHFSHLPAQLWHPSRLPDEFGDTVRLLHQNVHRENQIVGVNCHLVYQNQESKNSKNYICDIAA